jgi:hypothetical protein
MKIKSNNTDAKEVDTFGSEINSYGEKQWRTIK